MKFPTCDLCDRVISRTRGSIGLCKECEDFVDKACADMGEDDEPPTYPREVDTPSPRGME